MSSFAQFVRPHITDLPHYEPILPFEILSEQLGLGEEEIIKLDANENPYGPLSAATAALTELKNAHIYPDPESRALRQALSDYHGVPAQNIFAGAGADELIDIIMRLFLEPFDSIVVCPPTFGMYAFDARLNGAQVIPVNRKADFQIDIISLKTAILESESKLIFLASPNNPDGSLLSNSTLKLLLELPVILVLDEAYIEFAVQGESAIHHLENHENLVVLRTFSKWAGLAGLRVGYGFFPSWMMQYLWRIKQPYNVSVAASAAAIASLHHGSQLEERVRLIANERDQLFAGLDVISWLKPYKSMANFILCRVVGRSAAQLKYDLAKSGVLVRYFDLPELNDHIRISVGTPRQTDFLLMKLSEMD